MASRQKLTPVLLRHLHKRYLAGEPNEQIAKSAGCSWSKVIRAIGRAGLPFRERKRSASKTKFHINVRFPSLADRALIMKAADAHDESMNGFIVTAARERAKAA